MFDITVYQCDNEIETIKNLNSIQNDQVLKILSEVRKNLKGFKFEVKGVEVDANVNQFGRKKIDYLEYDSDEEHWIRK